MQLTEFNSRNHACKPKLHLKTFFLVSS